MKFSFAFPASQHVFYQRTDVKSLRADLHARAWHIRARRGATALVLTAVAGMYGYSHAGAAFTPADGPRASAGDAASGFADRVTILDTAKPQDQPASAPIPTPSFAQPDELLDPGVAARAFNITAPLDYQRALTCMTAAIYYEAATEPDAGQRAVAQVVLNRMAHPIFPKTVCGVVYQGSEKRTGCQFTFTCDGSLVRRPDPRFWARAEAVARAALSGAVYAPIGLATHYHTFAVHPVWDDSLNFVGQIGAHRFYRMEGRAGAITAFHFAYAGGEPLPGPHPRAWSGSTGAADDPLALERSYNMALARQATPAVINAGAQQDSGQSGAAQNDDTLPEYKSSGTWLRQPE